MLNQYQVPQAASKHIRLHAIYGIEGLVKEQTQRAADINPGRTIRVEVRVVPHNSDEIKNDKHESGKGDLPKKKRD
jgi:hypothetical protein